MECLGLRFLACDNIDIVGEEKPLIYKSGLNWFIPVIPARG